MASARTIFRIPLEVGSESGTAAIELALFLPFLLLLLTGIVELGVSAYEAMQVSNAAEAGALFAAATYAPTNAPAFSAASTASATTSGAALLPGSNTLTATPAPTQFCGCPSAAGSVSNLGAPPCSATACAGSTPAGTYVQVNASLNHMAIFPTTWGLPATFTATTIIRTN
jgi:Flp pilus assembly protein TadG